MKKFSVIGSLLLFLIIGGYGVFRWVQVGAVDVSTIFFGCLSLSYLFQSLTWGNPYGNKDKDELDRHIKTQSGEISYYVLMILSVCTLFISEGAVHLDAIKNLPLAFVVCLTFVVVPITEFIYSRKFR
ncbi:hypothetical protein [Brevibacillus dissolubilis]|uniref:hypothetical protein n=1 Tax=Brevibacillus dissolubilis TaxID=1844116 RepID=UPI001116EDAA|nr:hypothetical protein [Brevibacillus dissolubilis]